MVGIWTDKWLPKPSIFKVISLPNNTFELSRVSDLIDPLKCEWKTDFMRQIFIPPNVQSIPSIFLSSCLPRDRLVWAYTLKEKFIVRSAYKIALDEAMNSGVGEPSNGDTHRKLWRKIWRLNMLNKMKSFS